MERTMPNKRKTGSRDNGAGEKPYAVGYGRPPTRTQFKPGVSGNPKGRPKTTPTFADVTKRVLKQKIEMRIGDSVRRMSNKEAFVILAFRQAFVGKPGLLKILPTFIRFEVESLQSHTEASLNLTADDEVILADFLARKRASDDPDDGDPT